MKSSKTLAALVTLGLAAAAATPAMALEHQISGAFTSYYDLSNYSAAGNDGFATNSKGLSTDAKTENYFAQRVRLDYTAKANENVKLVTKFELDYNYWGNSSYTAAGGGGAALGADTINLETKNLYLDLNVVKGLNAKIGMQGYTDAFKGIIFDADMAGILLTHAYDKAAVSAGFFRFGDTSAASKLGKYTHDMFSMDGKYNISKDITVGAAYYYIADNRDNGSTITPSALPTGQAADGTPIYATTTTFTSSANPRNDTKVHTFGLNGETTVGPLILNGFAVAQFGDIGTVNNTNKAKGYALNVGAKLPLAGGTARAALLYAGGGKNSLYHVATAEGGFYFDNEMTILGRDKNATSIDNAIVFDANNYNQGVIFASVGYDYEFTQKLSGSANLGFASAAKTDKSVTDNKSDYLGTEINCEANYKLMPAVTLGARAGYVVLGDYFKSNTGAHGTYDNPYDIKLIAKYAF
ncbi:MAG: porin [Desulfuromonadaceae bacterium]|nr:porin [Desulfuromonadaceae bacterium]